MERFSDVPELLARVAGEHVVPGLAAAAVANGEIAHVATHGWRDLERQLPMTADTPSRWYSISKPLTALALAKLVDLDRPVREFLPGLRFADPVATERATVRDCLLHRTGLPGGDWTWIDGPALPGMLLERLPHVPCRPGFRAGHFYQNLNFTILGEVFKAAGTTWHQAIHDLLDPLGIKPLTKLSEFVAVERALGYGPNDFMPAEPTADFDFEAIAPASAVCGSITELAKLGLFLARGGAKSVTTPVLGLPAPEWKEWRSPCVAVAGRTVVYRGELVLQWAGGFRGYTSHLLAIPERKIAACALSNRSGSPASDLLAWSLLDRAAGWEPVAWADRFLEQKKRFRKASEKRLATRLARPSVPCPVRKVAGTFAHPVYGELTVMDGPRLRFRSVELPLVWREDGSVSADGSGHDFSEINWDLRAEVQGDEVMAWHFNPDDAGAPLRFARMS